MIADLRRRLAPPVFASEEQTRTAALLNTILLFFLAATLLYGLATLLTSKELPPSLLFVAIQMAILLFLYGWMRRSQVRCASVGLVAEFWLISTVFTIYGGGLQTTSTGNYLICIILASLLLGGRAAGWVAGVSIVTRFGVYQAARWQLLPPTIFSATPTSIWISEAIDYGFAALLLWLAARSLSQALAETRRQAQALLASNQALQASEAFSQAIFHSVAPHIAVLDRAGAITSVNQAWTNFARANTGSPSATGVGVNYLAVCQQATGADAPIALAAAAGIQVVLDGLQPSFTLEYPCDSPSEKRWFILSVTPLHGPQGGAVVSHINISERKRAEQSLQQSEARYRALVEAIPDGIVRVRRDGTYLDVKAPRSFTTVQPDMVIGHTLQEVLPPALAVEIQARTEAAIASRQMQVFEFDLSLNGAQFVREARLVPINHSEVTGIIRDITERKRTEQQLKRDLDAMTRLQRLGARSVQEGNLGPVLTEILDAAIAISAADFGNIQLLDPVSGHLQIAVQRGFAPWWLEFWNQVAKGQGACGTALEHGQRIIVEDVEQSPIFAGTPALEVQRNAGVRAVQSTPLISRSGKMMGMISTHYRAAHRSDDSTLGFLDLLAGQVGDIIEQAQAQAALRESEERYRTVVEMSPDGLVIYRQDRIIYANPASIRLLAAASTTQVLGQSPFVFIHPSEHTLVQERMGGLLAEGANNPKIEMRIVRLDGVTIDVEMTISQIPDQGQIAIQAVWRDITTRKRAETEKSRLLAEIDRQRVQVRTLYQRLAELQEEERKTLARELHDQVGANLSLLAVNLKLLHTEHQAGSTVGDATQARFKALQELLQQVNSRVRNIMAELWPPVLDDYGLLAALEWYAERVAAHSQLQITVHGDDPTPRPAPAIEQAFLRIAQEALANVVKHAQASQVTIRLTAQAEALRLTIADNGRGMDPKLLNDPSQGWGWGLLTMRERAEVIGGLLFIDSQPGAGTEIIVQVPLVVQSSTNKEAPVRF